MQGVLDQPRSAQRYEPKPLDDEPKLIERMRISARQRPRFGYRRIGAMLCREAWRASYQRVLRLWRREGLKVPQKTRKRRRLGTGANGCDLRRAEHKDHVWCWGFVFDRTASGSQLKWLSIVDEYTRDCLTLILAHGITSQDVIDALAELYVMRGVPQFIRSDNGPEFIAHAIRDWLAHVGVQTLHVEPGSRWENDYAETRDEFLALEIFDNLRSIRQLTAAWKEYYNHHRPNG